MNTGLGPLDRKIRRHIVENLIDEETIMGRGEDAHWLLSMRLAQALGRYRRGGAAAGSWPKSRSPMWTG